MVVQLSALYSVKEDGVCICTGIHILSEVKEIVYLEILSMEFTFNIYENIEDLYALGTCLMLWLMFLLIELMQ